MNKFFYNEIEIPFTEGMTIATALFDNQIKSVRTTQVKQLPRGAFCMMGACFDCLVIVDGTPNQQACQINATPGMKVQSQTSTTDIMESVK